MALVETLVMSWERTESDIIYLVHDLLCVNRGNSKHCTCVFVYVTINNFVMYQSYVQGIWESMDSKMSLLASNHLFFFFKLRITLSRTRQLHVWYLGK